MKNIRIFCDCCGKEIVGDDYGYFKLHYHAWGGGSMGGTEDQHHYEASELCLDCVKRLESVVKVMGIKEQYKFDKL